MCYGVWILRCRAGRLVQPVPLAAVAGFDDFDEVTADHEPTVHGRATTGVAIGRTFVGAVRW